MVISYNVANYFFGGVRVVFLFFFVFFVGVGKFVLGDLSEVLSGRDFVGHFVWGGGGGLPGVLSGGAFVVFFCRGGF